MAATLAEVVAKTVGKMLGDVEAESLVVKLPETLSEVMTKTIPKKLTCVKREAPVKTDLTLLQERRPTQLSTH